MDLEKALIERISATHYKLSIKETGKPENVMEVEANMVRKLFGIVFAMLPDQKQTNGGLKGG